MRRWIGIAAFIVLLIIAYFALLSVRYKRVEHCIYSLGFKQYSGYIAYKLESGDVASGVGICESSAVYFDTWRRRLCYMDRNGKMVYNDEIVHED